VAVLEAGSGATWGLSGSILSTNLELFRTRGLSGLRVFRRPLSARSTVETFSGGEFGWGGTSVKR